MTAGPEVSATVGQIMGSLTAHFALVTMRAVAQGALVEYAYQVRFDAEGAEERLLRRLEQVTGVCGLAYINQQTTVEL